MDLLSTLSTTSGATGSEEASLLEFINPSGFPFTLLGFLVTWLTIKSSYKLIPFFNHNFPKHRLLIQQFHTLFIFLLYFLGGLGSISASVHLRKNTLIALSGTLAVALGFALKDFAASVISSIVIIVSKPFQVGDRVSYGEYYGEVTDIGLRSVRIQTLDDNSVTVPSNRFLNDVVANANSGALDCMVVIKLYLDASANIIKAKNILKDAVLSSKYLFLEKPVVILVHHKNEESLKSYLEINAKAYVFDMRYEKLFSSDITERTLIHYQAENITLHQ